MINAQIPHVKMWTVEKHPPLEWLILWADIAMDATTPGFNAQAKRELTEAALKFMADLSGPDCCFVYSPDCPGGAFL